MSFDFLVRWSLLVEGSIFLGLLTLYFGHAVWFKWNTGRTNNSLAVARKIVMRVLNDDWPPDPEIEYLRKLPNRLKIKLFSDLAPSIGGDERGYLKVLAHRLDLIALGESLCKSRFWSNRLFGIRLLSMFNSGESIVPAMLGDKSPHVRAQVAEWAAEHPTTELIRAVMGLLNDPTDMCRFAAKDSLVRMDTAVVPQLVEYLAAAGNQDKAGALEVAIRLADHRFLAPATELSASISPRIRTLSAFLLGELGGEESSQILANLLSDSEPDVRATAVEAIGKLGRWTYISHVEPLLEDSDWNVRKSAGLALKSFGPPGILMLRHSVFHSAHEVADISKQILDLHELMDSAPETF